MVFIVVNANLLNYDTHCSSDPCLLKKTLSVLFQGALGSGHIFQ